MNYLELIGTIIGLIYLWLEYQASVYLWIAGVIMPVVYAVVYYEAGLYADLGINIYYILVSVYGALLWMGKGRKGVVSAKSSKADALPITSMPRRWYPILGILFALLWLGMALLLMNLTDSTVPWTDGFTTSLSIIAMWMLARKYMEQWLVWMVVDIVSVGLYIYKGLYFTAGLYALYAMIAWWGYQKWKKLEGKVC